MECCFTDQGNCEALRRPRANAYVLDKAVDLEVGLDFAKGDVLAHLELDEVLLAVDDLDRAVGHSLANVSSSANEKKSVKSVH